MNRIEEIKQKVKNNDFSTKDIEELLKVAQAMDCHKEDVDEYSDDTTYYLYLFLRRGLLDSRHKVVALSESADKKFTSKMTSQERKKLFLKCLVINVINDIYEEIESFIATCQGLTELLKEEDFICPAEVIKAFDNLMEKEKDPDDTWVKKLLGEVGEDKE